MITIDRITGEVTSDFTPEEKELLWRAIVEKIGPTVLAEQLKKREQSAVSWYY